MVWWMGVLYKAARVEVVDVYTPDRLVFMEDTVEYLNHDVLFWEPLVVESYVGHDLSD